MTALEAIYYLVEIQEKYIHGGDEWYDAQRKISLSKARIALQKQVSMYPIGYLDSVPHYRCPSCNGAVVVYENDNRYPCCQWCGQKLDWSY